MADARHPFLDRALEAYRVAVKAWSRDTLLASLVLLVAGVFIVAPYLRLDGQRVAIEADRHEAQAVLDELTAANEALAAATSAVEETQWRLQQTAEQIAADLSDDLRRVAHLAHRLRDVEQPSFTGGEPLAAPPPPLFAQQRPMPLPEGPWPGQAPLDTPAFPSAVRVEQWQAPPELPGIGWPADEAIPAEVGLRDFGLDDDAIAQLRQAFANGPGSVEWAAASALGEAVFRRQIEDSYGELERAVAADLEALTEELSAKLEQLRELPESAGVTLPALEELLPKATVVRLPPDDELFRSVAGKGEAFGSVGLYAVQLDLEAARAPMMDLSRSLAETRSAVEVKRQAITAREETTIAALTDIETRLAAIADEAGSLGAPLKWLALDTGLFARLYPTLLALALFWLAVRRARLDDLEKRLRQDYREAGIAERNVDLALYVPDAMLGGSHPTTAGSAQRWLPAMVAAAILMGVIAWITQQTPDAGTTAWLWQLPALLVGLAGCVVIARPGRWVSLGR